MFVAAVVIKRAIPESSHRDFGDWSCFISTSRKGAINKALNAVEVWGPFKYRVVVGKLTSAVELRRLFFLTKM
jgi:hypothetical protein